MARKENASYEGEKQRASLRVPALEKPEFEDYTETDYSEALDTSLGKVVSKNPLGKILEGIKGSLINLSKNCLPLVGGKLSGNLEIYRTWPEVRLQKSNATNGANLLCGTNNAIIETENEVDGTNYRRIVLFNSTAKSDIASSLQLHDTVDGSTTAYNIYGDHNRDAHIHSKVLKMHDGALKLL